MTTEPENLPPAVGLLMKSYGAGREGGGLYGLQLSPEERELLNDMTTRLDLPHLSRLIRMAVSLLLLAEKEAPWLVRALLPGFQGRASKL